ncbi:hypothetical protein M569_09938 [Genlisea aurea]|uniref:Uncharacterized protein n=1 Tax=Genlisea aurea TaxID=192259 RepID=S8CDC6_9LAMI|nr:hypothetical protein M569_09938 [Genlisea aurea]
MAGRNRLPRYADDFRSFPEDPRHIPLNRGPVLPPFRHPAALEEELDFQQREIQRLLIENRHVIDDNVMLERDLNAVKEEILRLNQAIANGRADRDAHTREVMDRQLKMEADLRSLDSVRTDIKQLRVEMQNLGLKRQELTSQIQSANKDINRLKSENSQIAVFKASVEKMQRELSDTRHEL